MRTTTKLDGFFKVSFAEIGRVSVAATKTGTADILYFPRLADMLKGRPIQHEKESRSGKTHPHQESRSSRWREQCRYRIRYREGQKSCPGPNQCIQSNPEAPATKREEERMRTSLETIFAFIALATGTLSERAKASSIWASLRAGEIRDAEPLPVKRTSQKKRRRLARQKTGKKK